MQIMCNKILGGAGPKGRTTHNLCPDASTPDVLRSVNNTSGVEANAEPEPAPAQKLLPNKFARSLYRSIFGPAIKTVLFPDTHTDGALNYNCSADISFSFYLIGKLDKKYTE